MATLPDIDTSNVSWIAYWNFLDAGGSDINPTEAASAMEQSQEYDNGVDGSIYISFQMFKNDRLIPCRVKDDGWIIAWLPRDQNTGNMSADSSLDADDLYGEFDVIDDWTYANGINTDRTKLSGVVNTLRQALSNGSEAAFNHTDVAHYNFKHPAATQMTIFSTTNESPHSTQIDVSEATNLHSGYIFGDTDYSRGTVKFRDASGTNHTVAGTSLGVSDDIVKLGWLKEGGSHVWSQNHVSHGDGKSGGYILWSE